MGGERCGERRKAGSRFQRCANWTRTIAPTLRASAQIDRTPLAAGHAGEERSWRPAVCDSDVWPCSSSTRTRFCYSQIYANAYIYYDTHIHEASRGLPPVTASAAASAAHIAAPVHPQRPSVSRAVHPSVGPIARKECQPTASNFLSSVTLRIRRTCQRKGCIVLVSAD